MFPLPGNAFPQSASELAAAMRNFLADVFILANKDPVAIDEAQWPRLGRVKIDLDDATLKTLQPPPNPGAPASRQSGIAVERLEVTGHPIRYQQSNLNFDLTASDAAFDFARNQRQEPLLVLADARDGSVNLRIAISDLQSLALAMASMAAAQHGASIQELQLSLSSPGPRAIAATARVKAKKMMMSGVITLRGQASIDDQLVATVSGLSCTGEGMAGTMIAAVIGAQLKKVEGQRFPLMALSLGNVSLRDVNVRVNDDLNVSAEFGRP